MISEKSGKGVIIYKTLGAEPSGLEGDSRGKPKEREVKKSNKNWGRS